MKEVLKTFIPKALQPSLLRLMQTPARQRFRRTSFPELSTLKCQIGYNKYGGYCVPDSSKNRPAARKVLAHEVYEPETINYIRKHAGDGDIVHAGTFFGDFLPAIAEKCGGQVWAFETNPQSHLCAKITILLNNLQNVNLRHAGLGETEKQSYVQTVDPSGAALGGASHVLESKEEHASEVAVVSIDATVPQERHVSIIQLDVEGYEELALKGALQTIIRCKPILILEITPDSLLLESEWLQDFVLSLGYRQQPDLHGNAVFSIG